MAFHGRSGHHAFLILAVLTVFISIPQATFAADKVRIGYTSPGPQHGILWVGDVSGFFKKNNLDLERSSICRETSPLRRSCQARFNLAR